MAADAGEDESLAMTTESGGPADLLVSGEESAPVVEAAVEDPVAQESLEARAATVNDTPQDAESVEVAEVPSQDSVADAKDQIVES